MAFEPTQVEKLTLWMLADIGEKSGQETDSYKFIKEAIYSGNFWALEWQFPGIFSEPTSKDVVTETVDILDMYGFIEDAGGEKFPGFDGNYEGDHVSAARFLTEKMERFESFKGRVSGGVYGLERYRAMLAKFAPMRTGLVNRKLTKEEVDSLKG